MYQTNQKGLLTELHCQLAFTEAGISLFVPISQDSKADFIADINNKLYRIQCKTASISMNKDFFQITCIASGYKNPTKYTSKDVDFYYTYCEGQSYLLPFEEGKSKIFRLKSPTSGNISNIRWAKDYELETVLTQIGYNIQVIKPTIIAKTLKENFCTNCGTPISSLATFCNKCNHLLNQRVVENRPTREELKNMIRNETFVEIGKKYNVSDNAIRKWCDFENLPRTKKDIKSFSDEEWEII